MGFVQIIEYTTTRLDEVEALMEEWTAATEGRRTTLRSIHGTDREQPHTYVDVMEFDSYEAAMRNSALPETTMFAERFVKLCDAPPRYRNLDVLSP